MVAIASRAYGGGVSEFLVETYAPCASAAPCVEDVSVAAARMSERGDQVSFVQAIFVPEDETCFYLYQSPSVDAVREAVARAGLRSERIVAAISFAAADRPAPGVAGHGPRRSEVE